MKLQLCVFNKYKILRPKKICKKNKKSSIKIGFIKNKHIHHINIIFIKWYILIILKKQNYTISKGLTKTIYNVIESFLQGEMVELVYYI